MLYTRLVTREDMDGIRDLYRERDIPIGGKSSNTALWTQFARRQNMEQEWTLILSDEKTGGHVLGIAVMAVLWKPGLSHKAIPTCGFCVAHVLDFYVSDFHKQEGDSELVKACLKLAVAASALSITVETGLESTAWAEHGVLPEEAPRLYKELQWNRRNQPKKETVGYYEHVPGIEPSNYVLQGEEFEQFKTLEVLPEIG